MKKQIILILILAFQSTELCASETVVISDVFVVSSHRATNVWTGKFTAYDGTQFDVSHYYNSEAPELSASFNISKYITDQITLFSPVFIDAGYQSHLYTVNPLLTAGIGLVMAQQSSQISFYATNLFQYGGAVSETSCYDWLNRDFHCGTGIPWTDYQQKTSQLPVTFRLNLKFLF